MFPKCQECITTCSARWQFIGGSSPLSSNNRPSSLRCEGHSRFLMFSAPDHTFNLCWDVKPNKCKTRCQSTKVWKAFKLKQPHTRRTPVLNLLACMLRKSVLNHQIITQTDTSVLKGAPPRVFSCSCSPIKSPWQKGASVISACTPSSLYIINKRLFLLQCLCFYSKYKHRELWSFLFLTNFYVLQWEKKSPIICCKQLSQWLRGNNIKSIFRFTVWLLDRIYYWLPLPWQPFPDALAVGCHSAIHRCENWQMSTQKIEKGLHYFRNKPHFTIL